MTDDERRQLEALARAYDEGAEAEAWKRARGNRSVPNPYREKLAPRKYRGTLENWR